MNNFQASLKQIFLKTTIPLIIYGAISLCNYPLQRSAALQSELNVNSKMTQPNSSFNPLQRFQNVLLDSYHGYFNFLFMMLVLNLSLMTIPLVMNLIQKTITNSSKNCDTVFRSQDDLIISLHSEKKQDSKGKLRRSITSLILYSICYLFYWMIGSSLGYLSTNISVENHPSNLYFNLEQEQSEIHLMNSTLRDDIAKFHSMRILEVVEEKEEEKSPTSSFDRGISLAIGKVFASFNTGADSIVLSKDSKFAYAVVSPSKGLKIFDLTNLQSPLMISSLGLGETDQFFSDKSLLSHDGKTLFICNERVIKIVNVSNPKLPKLVQKYYHQPEKKYVGFFGKMSLAITQDNKKLYIGGAGLTILNVTCLEAPTEILSIKYGHSLNASEEFITSLALASDGKTLYTTNGSLYVYNVTDPGQMRMIYEYETYGEASSIMLSRDEKIAYITGETEDSKTFVEKVDISNKKSASMISLYEHKRDADIEETKQIILGLAPNETNLYIDLKIRKDNREETSLLDLNLMTGRFQDKGDIVPQTSSMEFVNDGKHLVIGSNTESMIIELFLDYPNTGAFSLSNHSMSSFETKALGETMILSSDKKIMFCASGKNLFVFEGWLEIWNISSGNFISLTHFDDPIVSIKLSEDNKKMYLMGQSKFHVYDISDLSSPKEIYTVPGLENRIFGFIDFVITGDDRLLYILLKEEDSLKPVLKVVNLIDNFKIVASLAFPETSYRHKLELSKDNKRLFVIQENVQIFDVSNPSLLKEISAFRLMGNDDEPFVISSMLSLDDKLLFVQTRPRSTIYQLKICNISNGQEANIINEIALPQSFQGYRAIDLPSVFSEKLDKIYSIQQGSILITDISEPRDPRIWGLIPLPNWNDRFLNSLAISTEEKKIYILNGKTVQTLDLQVPHTVYIAQEKFLLGRRYSESVMLLKLGEEDRRYELTDKKNYQYIGASLLDMKSVASSGPTKLKLKFLPLLYWMNFDKENQVFSVEPKYQSDISTYTLCVVFSRKIPINAFDGLVNNSEKLLVSLITLGYVDNQRFLSASFDLISESGDFLVQAEPDYLEKKSKIYETLRGYLSKTCTKFEVLPSLELLRVNGKFRIGNLIGDNARVDIKLDSPCKFLYKTYGNLQPGIPAEKDRLTIEGSFKEVNAALQEIVVDIGLKNQTCGGDITLNDFSNPPVTETFRNLSDFFIKNEHPVMATKELSIQDQFGAASISTGQFFALTLHEKTFTDKSSDKLTYEVFMNDTRKSPVPSWLTVRGLTFQGTPPEEFFGREIGFMMIVKNEFKETRVAFTMKINLSSMFILKLVMKFAPYILTIIGFYISANRIYNILFKKRYRNPKNFYAEVGKEITDKEIFPVSFIKEEKRESRLIMRYLARSVVKELDLMDTHKYQIPFYFADPVTHYLNKARIAQVIEEVVVHDVKFEDKKKLRLYLSGDLACKSLIVQLVVNEIVMLQVNLQQEETTKSVFNKIKRNWTEIVERDTNDNKYIVDRPKLHQVLIQKLGNSEFLSAALNQENYESLLENESPILYEENYSEGSSASSGKVRRALDKGFLEYENKDSLLNMGLLEDALIAYAFDCQSLDICAIDTMMFVGQKVEQNIFNNFMKRDIKEIRFDQKYGMRLKVQNETLHFCGCPEERFDGKIMVVQIKTRKERILKEIWIYGVAVGAGVGKENGEQELMRESLLKGRRYEVL